MAKVEFNAMPDTARVWVFGAAAPVVGAARDALLGAVDEYLGDWRAHGAPLLCARDWRDDRFLAIAVDEAATGASGCSIDGMFRVLASAEPQVGTSLVGGGTIFWRDAAGEVHAAARSAFMAAAREGAVSRDTPVFDTTVATVADWRARFERPAAESWHARLVGA
ncbi:MAG TPA: hypothetical protein VE869_11770 [Gemmatimonas sp.]|nr:hypothetical protein [Gemmatimonas sp.]